MEKRESHQLSFWAFRETPMSLHSVSKCHISTEPIHGRLKRRGVTLCLHRNHFDMSPCMVDEFGRLNSPRIRLASQAAPSSADWVVASPSR